MPQAKAAGYSRLIASVRASTVFLSFPVKMFFPMIVTGLFKRLGDPAFETTVGRHFHPGQTFSAVSLGALHLFHNNK